MLVQARPKFGKSTFAATLNEFTKAHMGKEVLFIATERAEGGGTTSIQDMDVPFVQPRNYQELQAILASLQTDTTYGGVVLDNATDMVNWIIKPHALTFPTRGAPPPTRATGVAARDDYQVMGELTRQTLNQLINVTKATNPAQRKHLIVTVLERERQDEGVVTAIQPDLPGQMADNAAAMFELYCGIEIANTVKPDPANPKATIRVSERVFSTKGDGKRQLADRYKIFPERGPANLKTLMEEYWLPKVAQVEAKRKAAA
jgi:hypothetical protein